jgi:putative ABC transport system permease protein
VFLIIKNTRKIDWAQLGLNFTMIFAPGLLEKAPQTFIATVKASRAAEEPLARAVIDRFGNITAIRVREALEAVAEALSKIGLAARATAGLALVSGILVLAGAVAAGRRERTRDAVILKVTGTRRRDLALAYVIEYGIAAIAAALTASILGTLTAFLILTRVMDADWVFLPGPALAALIGTCLAVIGFGFAGTWRALAQSPAQVLRDTART